MFALGLGLVYATIFFAFPYFNDKLPLALALLVLYCLLAYGAIPLLLRFRDVLLRPDHIPLYAITPDGWPSDPVNIAVIANSKRHLIKSMQSAGWYTADKKTLINMLREVWAIVFNKPYPTAPFSTLYLFGRAFDIGFQMPTNDRLSPRTRHHVRFWRVRLPEKNKHHGAYDFWWRRLQHLFGAESQVWIGAAIDDIKPLGFQWRNGRLTHGIDTEIDRERDFIIQTLGESEQIKHTDVVQAGEPFTFRGQQFRNKFICDGSIRVVTLTNPVLDKIAP